MRPDALDDLGPLYHDWGLFGVRNRQLPGIFAPNQACKAPILRAYIQWAIAKCKTRSDDPVSFTELFCADAYYAMAALHFGATTATGVDNGFHADLTLPGKIAERLGLSGFRFVNADVHDMGTLEPADIVANLGGLYHVGDPAEVLAASYRLARRFLIVQTVYSLAETRPDYLQVPAPGQDWGCRFSLAWIRAEVARLGGTVVDEHTNDLEGNPDPKDRGSACFLIRKL